MASWSMEHQARAFPRTARVNELLREVIAEEMEKMPDFDDVDDIVTVTGVEVSPDLGHATVFVSPFSDEIKDFLDGARVDIQRTISRQVKLKRTPKLEFAADPAIYEGERVEMLLRKIHSDDHQTSADPRL